MQQQRPRGIQQAHGLVISVSRSADRRPRAPSAPGSRAALTCCANSLLRQCVCRPRTLDQGGTDLADAN